MSGLWLLLATFSLSAFGAGQVWLVQLSSYRLWRFVGSAEFHAYHGVWWRSIWAPVLAPAGLVFIGGILMIWQRPPSVGGPEVWIGATLQLALAAGTALWWGPLMARLETGRGDLDLPRYRRLMATHWLRVAIVSGYALLLAHMTAESLGLLPPHR
jgi:hypothetical protein